MNRKLTATEIKIRELAEKSNPYDKICPNRHLWNEGFVCALETYKAEAEQLSDEDIEKWAEKRYEEWLIMANEAHETHLWKELLLIGAKAMRDGKITNSK